MVSQLEESGSRPVQPYVVLMERLRLREGRGCPGSLGEVAGDLGAELTGIWPSIL